MASVLLALLSLAPAASTAAEPPSVRVRAGVHEDYNRLVFDWQDAVTYRVVEESGRADIYFDRPVAFDLSRVRKKPPPLFKSVEAERQGDATVVHIVLPKGVKLRHRLLGTRVVIDVFPPTATARAEAPAKQEKKIPVPIARPAQSVRPVAEAEPAVRLGPAATAAGTALAASLSGTRVGNWGSAGTKPAETKPAGSEPRPRQ